MLPACVNTMCYMERVGIRELRRSLSVYLAKRRRATDRGKPVAVLKPLAMEDDTWQRLVDAGVVVPAAGKRSDIEPSGRAVDSDRTVSKGLQELREDRA